MSTSSGRTPESSHAPAGARPIWLTVLCGLLWSYIVLGGTLFLCGILTHLLDLGDIPRFVTSFGLAYGVPLLVLLTASVGLWRMRKWGGLLYGVYLIWEAARTLIGGTLPFLALPLGIFLIDRYDAQAIVAQYNNLYLVFLAGVGAGVLYVWIRRRLV